MQPKITTFYCCPHKTNIKKFSPIPKPQLDTLSGPHFHPNCLTATVKRRGLCGKEVDAKRGAQENISVIQIKTINICENIPFPY